MAFSDMIEKRWRYGGPWDIWVRYHDVIKDLVKTANLRPVPAEQLPGLHSMAAKQAEAVMQFRPIPFPGGMKIAHLHAGDDIFLVNEQQWSQFTQKVLKDFSTKLANAKQVSFDQLMDVADAVHGVS